MHDLPPVSNITMFEFMRGRQQGTGVHRLGRTFLLAGLKAAELNIVEGFVHDRRYLPGEIVFDEGEEGQALYIVLSGRILICQPNRVEQPIAELGPGEFFGELALLGDSPRSAQARAGEASELAVLFRGDFERLMEAHIRIGSHIAFQLARYLGQRLRGMVSRLPQETRGQ